MSRPPMRGRGMPMHGKLEKPDKNTVKRLFSYIGKYKLRFLFVFICILLLLGELK